MHAFRTSSGFGANPVLPSEIETWARLTGFDINPEVALVLLDVESAYKWVSARASELAQQERSLDGKPFRSRADGNDPEGIRRVFQSLSSRQKNT